MSSPPTVVAAPAWTIPGYLEVGKANNRLAIGGVDALALARDFETPLFVFSEERIRSNIQRLQQAANGVGRPVKFCYASKACSNMAVLAAVRAAGIDLEVNSGGELYKAVRAGFRPAQIIFNGTSKTIHEIEHAVSLGIYAINVDSLYEIELVAGVAQALEKRARIALRLVPDVGTRSHLGLQTALLTSKFGISASEVAEAFRRALDYKEHLDVCGIHIHVGSQTPDAEPFARAFKTMCEHLVELEQATGHTLDHVNLGGGFPVNYLRDARHAAELPASERAMLNADLDLALVISGALAAARSAIADSTCAARVLERATLLFEPGRSVIGDAAIVLTTVRNIKQRAETNDVWLLTDAGYNLLLSMNNYKWYYHLVSASRAGAQHDVRYKVAGPLCDSGDVYFDIERKERLPDYRQLPADVRPGEVLALLNAGAYTLAQMFPYNGRPLPAAVMVREGGVVDLIRRRDTYEDLLAQDVW